MTKPSAIVNFFDNLTPEVRVLIAHLALNNWSPTVGQEITLNLEVTNIINNDDAERELPQERGEVHPVAEESPPQMQQQMGQDDLDAVLTICFPIQLERREDATVENIVTYLYNNLS